MSPTATLTRPARSIASKAPVSAEVRREAFEAPVERLKRTLPHTIEAEELYSVGVTGLVAAARNHRASKAGPFAAYTATRIRGAMLDELRRQDWMSRSGRANAKRLGSALSKLEQEQGGEVTPEALCAELQMNENLRLADIAACFGVTEPRISQIHTQALKGLRAFLHRSTTFGYTSFSPGAAPNGNTRSLKGPATHDLCPPDAFPSCARTHARWQSARTKPKFYL